MVYAEPGDPSPVKTVDTSNEERDFFSLTDNQVEALAGMAMTIEAHYGKPMDIESVSYTHLTLPTICSV